MELLTPTAESIKFAQESAERLSNLEITETAHFYSDECENSNSIDKAFVVSLENKEHLTDEYRSKYIAGISD